MLGFDAFVNENYANKVNEDGYGEQAFLYTKNGDVANYFFKVEGVSEAPRGFVLSIGKFSKFAQPSEAKQEYAVLGLTELPVDKLDQAVIDKGVFEINNNQIDLNERELNKVLDVMAKCAGDYLEKNSKVTKMYDEVQGTLKNLMYNEKLVTFLNDWPGGAGAWKLQEVEQNLNYIIK